MYVGLILGESIRGLPLKAFRIYKNNNLVFISLKYLNKILKYFFLKTILKQFNKQ